MAQSKERKGSNFAIWQPCEQRQQLREREVPLGEVGLVPAAEEQDRHRDQRRDRARKRPRRRQRQQLRGGTLQARLAQLST